MKIGHKLKDLRTAHGYTQEELAAILNVSRSTISSWEINRTYPDLSMLVSLSELYEITLDQLINEDDKLVDTMTNETKTNTMFKRIILSLSIVAISLAVVVVFVLKTNSNPVEPEVTQYGFSDYPKVVQEDGSFFYKGEFIREIIDTLPDGTETNLIQADDSSNTHYDTQITLKVSRDKRHRIDKVTVLNDKNVLSLLKKEHGGRIHAEKYGSIEELKSKTTDGGYSTKKENPNELLVFVRNDGTHVTCFFQTIDKND